jgi:hypothetical protein
MNDPSGPDPYAGRLRVMRILHAALCLGVLFFLVIVLALGPLIQPPPAVPLVSYILAGFAVVSCALAWLMPRVAPVSAGRQPGIKQQASDRDRWWGLYQTRLLLRCAPLEGGAFAQFIAYLLEGQPFSLGLGLALLLLLALQFPTRDRVEAWAEAQEERARQAYWD